MTLLMCFFPDDGCGMSLDVLRNAFDPFFTTRRDRGSTGLGLHIVHTIVTNFLGGRLHLDSDPARERGSSLFYRATHLQGAAGPLDLN